MKRTVAVAVLAAGLVGCAGSSGSAGRPAATPPEKRTDVTITTPGADVDVHGRKPAGTGKADVDVDVKKR